MISYFKKVKGNTKKIGRAENNTWIKAISPTEEEIKVLEKKFDLDEQLIKDGLDPNELPRIEKEGSNVYIYLRIPRTRMEEEATATLLMVLTTKNIITISNQELKLYETLEGADINLSDTEEFLVKTLRYIFRKYNSNVRKILKEVKRDKRNLSRLRNKDILDLVLQEDVLNDYIASLFPMISMHNRILKLNVLKLDREEKDEIEDLIVDLTQTYDNCKLVKKTITNMRDYYSAMVSNRINDSITILTVFTIFLTIPTVISGIYGMNINLPFQNNPYIFWILVGGVIAIWAILFKFFKRILN